VGRQCGMSYARLTNTYFMLGGCFCAHRCCLESVMHARNCVSCVPSELGSTTVMVNYKCKLQYCSSRRKLKLCQGASCHCCTDALSWRCTSWCPSASGSGSSVGGLRGWRGQGQQRLSTRYAQGASGGLRPRWPARRPGPEREWLHEATLCKRSPTPRLRS